MPEATLLLRLAGPTQAWDSRRATVTPPHYRLYGPEYLTPTVTGIAGLLACALGRERGMDMSDLLSLRMVVRVDQPGSPRTEFRTTRRLSSTGDVLVQPMVESVLDDAVFLAGVSGDRDLVEAAAAAVEQPRWPLYLGKREYPPTLPLGLGVLEHDAEAAVRAHPWIAANWRQRATEGTTVVLRMLALHPRRRSERPAVDLDPVVL